MTSVSESSSKSKTHDSKPRKKEEVKEKFDKDNDGGITREEIKTTREEHKNRLISGFNDNTTSVKDKISLLYEIADDEKFARNLEENFYKIDINRDNRISDTELEKLACLDGDPSSISKYDFSIVKDGKVTLETPIGNFEFPADKLNPSEGLTPVTIEEAILSNNAIQLQATDPQAFQALKNNGFKLSPETAGMLEKTPEGQSLKTLLENGYEVVDTDNYASNQAVKDSSANVLILRNPETGVTKFVISGTNFFDLSKETAFKDIVEDVKAELGAHAKQYPILNEAAKKLGIDLTQLQSDQLNAVTQMYDEYIQNEKARTGESTDVDIVGFSLGGGIAQALAEKTGDNCIAFNPVTPRAYTDANKVPGISSFTVKTENGFEFVSKLWQPLLSDPNIANNEFVITVGHRDNTNIPIVKHFADILEGHSSVQPGAIEENVRGLVDGATSFITGLPIIRDAVNAPFIGPALKGAGQPVKSVIIDGLTYLFSVDYDGQYDITSR
jgi:dienelactone hydrolase